jgi:adenylate cyclase
LKKEIFFTGDVLNTTAPIQSPSYIYGVYFLLSKSLVDRLGLTDNYSVQVLGEPHPKGKIDALELATVAWTEIRLNL